MTYEEFLADVKALKLKWSLRPGGTGIRCKSGDCPLIALAKAKGLMPPSGCLVWKNRYFRDAGRALGIADQASQIATAADAAWAPLRKQMEEALLEQSG